MKTHPRLALTRRLLMAAVSAGLLAGPSAAQAEAPASLATAVVASAPAGGAAAFDGTVQAVRQTTIAAQVAGAVVALDVRAGDRVRAGQVLLRLDARAAEQTAAAAGAQVRVARAQQDAATREFERQKQLFEKNYISQAALDRAEAQYKAATAEAAAQLSSAGAAQVQSGFFAIRAPYAGIVSDVQVVLGDMAMPGRPLLTVYDPAALRVSAAIPQTVSARIAPGSTPEAEIPGLPTPRIASAKTRLLPAVDPATHTRELQLELPSGLPATPGMFARVWLAVAGDAQPRLFIPARAVLRRAGMTAAYVVPQDGRPLLRQVRLGRVQGDQVEVLTGLTQGERVALDPQAAARVR